MTLADRSTLPRALDIALACQRVELYSPFGQLALAKLMIEPGPRRTASHVEGVWLQPHQAVVFEAQIMLLLGSAP